MEVNATGMFYLLRELSAWMSDTGGGSVINIASMMGMKGPDYSNYKGTSMGDLPPDYFFHNAGLINLNRFMCKNMQENNFVLIVFPREVYLIIRRSNFLPIIVKKYRLDVWQIPMISKA